jgi:hypothetical protein
MVPFLRMVRPSRHSSTAQAKRKSKGHDLTGGDTGATSNGDDSNNASLSPSRPVGVGGCFSSLPRRLLAKVQVAAAGPSESRRRRRERRRERRQQASPFQGQVPRQPQQEASPSSQPFESYFVVPTDEEGTESDLHSIYSRSTDDMSAPPIDEDAVAAADKEMEERANRAKELLSNRYVGLKRAQVSHEQRYTGCAGCKEAPKDPQLTCHVPVIVDHDVSTSTSTSN